MKIIIEKIGYVRNNFNFKYFCRTLFIRINMHFEYFVGIFFYNCNFSIQM